MEKWSNSGTGWSGKTISSHLRMDSTMNPWYFDGTVPGDPRSMLTVSGADTAHILGGLPQPNCGLQNGVDAEAHQPNMIPRSPGGTSPQALHAFSPRKSDLGSPTATGSLDSLLHSNSSSMVDSTSERDEEGCLCSASSEPVNLVFPGLSPAGVACLPRAPPKLHRTASPGTSTNSVSILGITQGLQLPDSPASGQNFVHAKEFFCLDSENPLATAVLHTATARDETEDALGVPVLVANTIQGLRKERECGVFKGEQANSNGNSGLKRSLGCLATAEDQDWMDPRSQKTLMNQDKAAVFQESSIGFVGPSFGASYLGGHSPLGVPGPAIQSFGPPTVSGEPNSFPDKMASMRAMLFRPPFPVPTAAEIESSRPKRRNVRISKDPQSVAARHRRERISDRIRVLQRLVPGGTKMDTASMLDEAIHYVKFLKSHLQALEQLGNNCDPRCVGGLGIPPISNAGRPFDLNCSAFRASSTTTGPHSNSQAGSQSNGWHSAPSPFCAPGFHDPMREQFCH